MGTTMNQTEEARADPFLQSIRAALSAEPDPRFAASLGDDLRARRALATAQLFWFDMATSFGQIRIVHDGRLVHLVSNDPANFEAFASERLGFLPQFGGRPSVAAAVAAVLAGRKRGTEVAYLGTLASFQRQVLQVTARIPRGEVRPYGWVARKIGLPGAVRATGTALGHNPVPFVVPCHRVVRSDWQLGEYSARGGTATKERLLRSEGVDTECLDRLRAGHVRFQGSRTTHIFCLPTCYSGKHLQPANLVNFHDEREARGAGYRPCLLCQPA
jgi:methylated-DNA-[protein]-cysteine S-methyltransferase